MHDVTVVWRSFDELQPRTLYALLQLRQSILVVEQKSAYPDLDGQDTEARHLLAVDGGGAIVGYARLFGPRFKDDLGEQVTSFGRLVVVPEKRKSGLGRKLMRECLARLDHDYPDHDVRISAQTYLAKFYAEVGFEPDSQPYDDCGIEHIDMRIKRR